MESINIFLLVFIIALIFLILDCIISKSHLKLEKFENSSKSVKKISPATSKLEDISFLNDINNENLTIKDFYPSKPYESSQEKLLKFVFNTDLFHQIIPKFGGGYLGLIWFDNRLNGIYEATSLSLKDWGKIPNSIPDNMIRPIFITYDKDKKLLGIFEEKTDSMRKYHLYK